MLKKPVSAAQPEEISAMESGIALYKGDLLEGVYDDWAIRAREHERLLYLSSLAYLLQYHHEQQNYKKSLGYGQRILTVDPLREEIHREMMRLYLEIGQRAQAIRQYEDCRTNLLMELGIAPMEETQALYKQIVTETGRNQQCNQLLEGDFQHAVRQLIHTRLYLEQAMKAYTKAVANIEKYIDEDSYLEAGAE